MRAAHVLILSPDNELILQHRDNKVGLHGADQITTWGGACEPGESPLEAATRELGEELGLTVAESDLVFWRQYKKTKEKHGRELAVHLFILKTRIVPASLTVYEGQGYRLVKATDNFNVIKFSPLAGEFVRDFFKEGLEQVA